MPSTTSLPSRGTAPNLFDPVFPATHVEHMGHVCSGRAIGIARRKGELDAVAYSK